MTAPLVFMDTETTGLSLDDDIWEFAAVRRDPDGTETELHLLIDHDRDKCKHLPESFREDHYDRYRDHRAFSRRRACSRIYELFDTGTERAHVVGAVPNFDTERLLRLFQSSWSTDYEAQWHYHLIDVENLAVGFLAHYSDGIYVPPWDSNQISKAVGVDPDQFERHTAMGDVRWAMAIYDAVMGGAE